MNRYVSTVAVIQALGLMKSVSPRGRDRVKTQTDATAQGRGIRHLQNRNLKVEL